MNTRENAGAVKLRVLKTSTLIRRFLEKCPITEIYDKAVRCYETLIDSIEKPAIAKEISALLNIPAVKVKEHAESVINILLFNKENDPYLSFGLERNAPFSEVNRKWRRLIVLYHPDRHQNQKIVEDKVKKINEIYSEIQKIQNQKIISGRFNTASKMSVPQSNRIIRSRYLKYIPSLIIALAVMIALFSLVLFIFDLISPDPSASSRKPRGKEIKIIRIDLDNVNTLDRSLRCSFIIPCETLL
ncbi:MAG: J domain-containing protein [Nitrospirota bacterium]|nr:J domain-containing protein [Nitrospirota bacterium]